LLYAASMRVPRLTTVLEGASVALPTSPGPVLLPEACACCAEAATHRVAMTRKDGVSLLVGYCDECAEHQASTSSRVLSLTLASVLLALASAAGLPLLLPRLGLFGLLFAVCALSLLPLLLTLLPARPVLPPHAARGPALYWGANGELLCASPAYAARVATVNGGTLASVAVPERWGSAWLCTGPVLGVGAACLSFFVYHPLLRVLNLGPARVEVALDGQRLVAVDATSNESPAGGALVRVPAGAHTLSVTSSVDGSALGESAVEFHSGAVHLFAFGADDTCFWLETTGYGQERRAALSYQALPAAEHFWVLPGGIDTWFAANPEPSEANTRSSGGLLTALRQAPCSVAPPEVRR